MFPDFYVTVDHDDINVPSSISQLQQYGKCKGGILRPNSWFTYKLRPTCNRLIYNGVTSAYSIGNNDWVDCVNYAVPYYGAKWGLNPRSTNLTQNLYFECRAKYTVWFKNVH